MHPDQFWSHYDLGVDAKKILLVNKLRHGDSNSVMAQGGTQAADRPNDSPVTHFIDTMGGGHFTNKPDVLKALTEDAPSTIKWLCDFGAMFDRNEDGNFTELSGGGNTAKAMGEGAAAGAATSLAMSFAKKTAKARQAVKDEDSGTFEDKFIKASAIEMQREVAPHAPTTYKMNFGGKFDLQAGESYSWGDYVSNCWDAFLEGFVDGAEIAANEYTFGLTDRFGLTEGSQLVSDYGGWDKASQVFARTSREATLSVLSLRGGAALGKTRLVIG